MLDLTKPLQTECGYEAEIIKYDCLGDYPLVVVIKTAPDRQVAYSYDLEGLPNLLNRTPRLCLINVSEKRTVWIKELKDGSVIYSYERPVPLGGTKSIIKVEFTSGQIDE